MDTLPPAHLKGDAKNEGVETVEILRFATLRCLDSKNILPKGGEKWWFTMVKGKKSPTKQIQGFCVDDGVDETGLASGKIYIPKTKHFEPQNNGLWKMYLRLQTWRHFGYLC